MIKLWTKEAIKCYLRKQNCQGCFFEDFFSADDLKCEMCNTVKYLLKEIGKPTQKQIKNIEYDEVEEKRILKESKPFRKQLKYIAKRADAERSNNLKLFVEKQLKKKCY